MCWWTHDSIKQDFELRQTSYGQAATYHEGDLLGGLRLPADHEHAGAEDKETHGQQRQNPHFQTNDWVKVVGGEIADDTHCNHCSWRKHTWGLFQHKQGLESTANGKEKASDTTGCAPRTPMDMLTTEDDFSDGKRGGWRTVWRMELPPFSMFRWDSDSVSSDSSDAKQSFSPFPGCLPRSPSGWYLEDKYIQFCEAITSNTSLKFDRHFI